MTVAELLARLPQMEEARRACLLRQIIVSARALTVSRCRVHGPSNSWSRTARSSLPAAAPRTGPAGTVCLCAGDHGEAPRDWKVIDLKRELLRRGWAPVAQGGRGTLRPTRRSR